MKSAFNLIRGAFLSFPFPFIQLIRWGWLFVHLFDPFLSLAWNLESIWLLYIFQISLWNNFIPLFIIRSQLDSYIFQISLCLIHLFSLPTHFIRGAFFIHLFFFFFIFQISLWNKVSIFFDLWGPIFHPSSSLIFSFPKAQLQAHTTRLCNVNNVSPYKPLYCHLFPRCGSFCNQTIPYPLVTLPLL